MLIDFSEQDGAQSVRFLCGSTTRTLYRSGQQPDRDFDGFPFFPSERVGNSKFVVEMIGAVQADLDLLRLLRHRAINQFLNRAG
jgi:hypothetical protein